MKLSRNDAVFILGFLALVVGLILGKLYVWLPGLILALSIFGLTGYKMLSAQNKKKAALEEKYRERMEQENEERERLGLSRTLD